MAAAVRSGHHLGSPRAGGRGAVGRQRRGTGAAAAGLRGSGQQRRPARPPPVEATAWMSDRSWLLEVIDAAGEQAPTQAVDRDPALGGLGLGLVAALCDEVGWERLGDGRKLVWARLDLSGNGTSGRPVANGLPHRAGYGTLHRSAAGTSATGTTTAAYDRDQLAFLAEVSDTLIRTLDTGATAEHLARLAVPRLADW